VLSANGAGNSPEKIKLAYDDKDEKRAAFKETVVSASSRCVLIGAGGEVFGREAEKYKSTLRGWTEEGRKLL